MTSKRYLLPDLVKLILAFLVVNLHVESFVTGAPFSPLYFLGWLAVPLFVSLSFYFNSRHYLGNFAFRLFRSKLWRLLLPFFVWSVVGFCLHPDLLSIKYLLRQLLTGTAVDPPLYYLLTVALVSLLFYLLTLVFRSHQKLIVFALITLSLTFETTGFAKIFYAHLPIQISLAVERIEEFIKYAGLGILLPALADRLCSRHTLITSAAFVSTGIYVWEMWRTSPTDLNYSGIIQFIIVILIMLALIYAQTVSFGRFGDWLISHFAPYSLGIYCFHTFLVELTPLGTTARAASICIFMLSLALSWGLDHASVHRLQAVVT